MQVLHKLIFLNQISAMLIAETLISLNAIFVIANFSVLI